MHEGNSGSGMVCRCTHHKMKPILIILFALLFTLGNFDVVSARTVSVLWPIIVGIGGISKLSSGWCKCC
jgi:hypothetical protein